MVTTRKNKTGGRSGVVITELDDSNVGLDGWLDSAQSPEGDSKQKATATASPKEDKLASGKKAARKKKVKTPKQRVEMELKGAQNEDSTEGETDSSSAKKYVSKLKSPSDLSKVSTVAYSPQSEGSNEDEETGGVDDSEALLTQENVANHAANAADDNLAIADDEFPVNDGDDDLAPPLLPQDSSNDEESKKEDSEDEKIESGSFGNNDDYDDGDDGPGFNMVHDPETPLTVREQRAKKEMDKIREERRKKNRENGIDTESEDNDDDDEENNKSAMLKKNKKSKKKDNRRVVFSPKGIPIANRDYQTVPIGAYVEGSPDEGGPRRSRRAKFKPLEFWRGEKIQYGAHEEHGFIGKAFGDMPVVTGVQKALPTPYKKRKQVTKKSGGNKSSRKNDSSDAIESVGDEEFDSKKLRRKYEIDDGEEAFLYDDINELNSDQKVVAYSSKMTGSSLPLSKRTKRTRGVVTGKAAQAFNVSAENNENYVGYIMGNLILAPKAIKDAESVGPCAQTFTVCWCQPKAVEIAYGDPNEPDGELNEETATRFLLGPGDMFRIPPGNSYRLENHSEAKDCYLTWTIIRPTWRRTATSEDES